MAKNGGNNNGNFNLNTTLAQLHVLRPQLDNMLASLVHKIHGVLDEANELRLSGDEIAMEAAILAENATRLQEFQIHGPMGRNMMQDGEAMQIEAHGIKDKGEDMKNIAGNLLVQLHELQDEVRTMQHTLNAI